MKSKGRSLSLVAAVMGALIAAPIQPLPVFAGTNALTNNTLSITSGSINVFASNAQTLTSTGINLSTSISNGTAKTFFVNNAGSLTVSRFFMTVTLPNNANVSTFRRCAVNVAFTGANICASGSSTAVTGLSSGSSKTYSLTLPNSGFYSFQVGQNKTGTMTVSTSASLSNVSGATLNS